MLLPIQSLLPDLSLIQLHPSLIRLLSEPLFLRLFPDRSFDDQ